MLQMDILLLLFPKPKEPKKVMNSALDTKHDIVTI